MNAVDFLIIAIISVAVIIALRHMHRNRGKGCTGCCSACDNVCPYAKDSLEVIPDREV